MVVNTNNCGWWGSPGHLSLNGWGWIEGNLTPEPGVQEVQLPGKP